MSSARLQSMDWQAKVNLMDGLALAYKDYLRLLE